MYLQKYLLPLQISHSPIPRQSPPGAKTSIAVASASRKNTPTAPNSTKLLGAIHPFIGFSSKSPSIFVILYL
jgi:hypothetical protein